MLNLIRESEWNLFMYVFCYLLGISRYPVCRELWMIEIVAHLNSVLIATWGLRLGLKLVICIVFHIYYCIVVWHNISVLGQGFI